VDVDTEGLRRLATQCVNLVKADFGRDLNFSSESLRDLDAVCAELTVDGPLSGDRLNLWWRCVGAYTGEVVIRAYEGRWITHEMAPGAYAIEAMGSTGFPFGVAHKILRGEWTSLANFGQVFPAVASRQGGAE
jgi:hypothetical protein